MACRHGQDRGGEGCGYAASLGQRKRVAHIPTADAKTAEGSCLPDMSQHDSTIRLTDSVLEADRQDSRKRLVIAIRKFPLEERQEEIANALREIDTNDHRQKLKEQFDRLSAADTEALLAQPHS
jgi:hypothetical protein